MAYKTIHVERGVAGIRVINAKGHSVFVWRLDRLAQLKCRHCWHAVDYAHRGHGKWQHGCIHCGALAR